MGCIYLPPSSIYPPSPCSIWAIWACSPIYCYPLIQGYPGVVMYPIVGTNDASQTCTLRPLLREVIKYPPDHLAWPPPPRYPLTGYLPYGAIYTPVIHATGYLPCYLVHAPPCTLSIHACSICAYTHARHTGYYTMLLHATAHLPAYALLLHVT